MREAKTAFIYLLVGVDDHAGMFKIGFSINPDVRRGQLAQSFDMQKSVCVEYEIDQARKNESWLHQHFAPHSIKPEVFQNAIGKTEWFDMTCFDEAIAILEYNESISGIKPIVKRTVRLNVDIPASVYKALKLDAVEQGRTISEITTEMIYKYIAEENAQ